MNISILSDKRALLAVLIIGLVARFFLIIFFSDHNLLFYDADSYEYLALAENMKLGHGFSWDKIEPYEPNSFRTPIYPGFLFLARYLFGSYKSALFLQAFLVTLSAYFLYLIGYALFKNRKIALWSAGIFLFMPFSLNVSVKFLTQTLFTFLLILAVWSWLNFLSRQDKKYFFLTSLLLPILALTRPIAQYLPIVFLLSLSCATYTRQFELSLKSFFKLTGLMLAVFFLILSPWLIRNYKLFKVFALSSITPYQLYFYDLPDIYALANKISYQQASDILKTEVDNYSSAKDFNYYMKFEAGKLLWERSRYHLVQHPIQAFVSRAKNGIKFFLRDGIRYWYNDFDRSKRTDVSISKILSLKEKNLFPYFVILERTFLGILFAGMLFAIIRLFKENKTVKVFTAFLILILAYFSFLTGIMASAGLRFPVEPIFILNGLWGLNKLYQSYVA